MERFPTAIIKANEDFSLRLFLPNGESVTFDWNTKNGRTLEIPTTVVYNDRAAGKVRVYEEAGNFAQNILNAHPDLLELVETKVPPPVDVSTVVQPPVKAEVPKKRGRPPKQESVTEEEKDEA